MNRKPSKYRKSPIRILEEALYLLRCSPISLLTGYYIGSLPFILGLLYFYNDMIRSPFAEKYYTVAALGLTILFIWMKCWHVVFAVSIREKIMNSGHQPWPFARIIALVANQTLIQSTSLIILPMAVFTLFLPMIWCYPFYQNITAISDKERYKIKPSIKSAFQLTLLWPIQNFFLIVMIMIFYMIVFSNLAQGAFLVPRLLKMLFGIDTIFTISGASLFNSTFLVTMTACSYLCVDPILKTSYVLRCFYGSTIKSGEDIKIDLRRLTKSAKVVTASLLIGLFVSNSESMAADDQKILPTESSPVTVQELDQSIKKVLEQREFTWRLPREKHQKTDSDFKLPGPVESVILWVQNGLKKIRETIKGWIDRFVEWLKKGSSEKERAEQKSGTGWITSVRVLLIIFLMVAIAALAYFFWNTWQRRQSQYKEVKIQSVTPTPDLTDENVKADELPVNQWLALAKELTAKGSLRLAMRALYLATLAYLADKEMITIAYYKSNRDYAGELGRRAHEKKRLLTEFLSSVTIFDQVWYGMYKISLSDLDRFSEKQKRIMGFVE